MEDKLDIWFRVMLAVILLPVGITNLVNFYTASGFSWIAFITGYVFIALGSYPVAQIVWWIRNGQNDDR